ncbi:hypothetical protein H2203_001414 [Taxawa tesnikishii (nom. ined.)]|nr:hypothetical protein H2203_001414 [Dothideales sp. JES 119]
MVLKATVNLHVPSKDLLSWIFDNRQYDLDKPMFLDALNPKRFTTSRQALTLVRQTAAGLLAAGLEKGDCIYYSILFLGIVAAGGIFVGTNPSYTTAELRHHISTSGARFLIAEPRICANAIAAARECGILKSHIWMFDAFDRSTFPSPSYRSWTTLLNHGEADWQWFDNEEPQKKTVAGLLFSSGTTGLPKAAMLSHRNLVAQHELEIAPVRKTYEVRRLVTLPMFHAATVPMCHTTTMKAGYQTFVMRRFNVSDCLSAIHKQKITDICLVPPMVLAVLQSPETTKEKLASVRDCYLGAAPLNKETQNALAKLLPDDAKYTQIWAMTETSCNGTQFNWPEQDDTGSVGRPIPNMDIKLLDEAGNDISDTSLPGELSVRCPTVFKGYFQNPTASAASFTPDGFFLSGDIARRDLSTNKWYILIKVRGFQVAPAELEGVLVEHPDISDAAVIGVWVPQLETELPRAYVVRTKESLGEREVKKWVEERLAGFKRLEGGISFVDAIPKNATGKILKRILREKWDEETRKVAAKL